LIPRCPRSFPFGLSVLNGISFRKFFPRRPINLKGLCFFYGELPNSLSFRRAEPHGSEPGQARD